MFEKIKKNQDNVQPLQDLTEEQLLNVTGGAATTAATTDVDPGKHLAKGHAKHHGKGKALGHTKP